MIDKMTSQNLIITNLMSDLVRRNGSDLHLTGDTVPYFRVQGSILPASESIYKEENLISDLKTILGEDKLKYYLMKRNSIVVMVFQV